MRDLDRFDWETREDASTLRRFAELRNDPERMDKARQVLEFEANNTRDALGLPDSRRIPSRGRNAATIMKLNPKY